MGTLVCFALVSVMELVAIKKVTPHPPKYLRVFVKPAIAAGVMGAAVWASYGLLAAHLGNTLSVDVYKRQCPAWSTPIPTSP